MAVHQHPVLSGWCQAKIGTCLAKCSLLPWGTVLYSPIKNIFLTNKILHFAYFLSYIIKVITKKVCARLGFPLWLLEPFMGMYDLMWDVLWKGGSQFLSWWINFSACINLSFSEILFPTFSRKTWKGMGLTGTQSPSCRFAAVLSLHYSQSECRMSNSLLVWLLIA